MLSGLLLGFFSCFLWIGLPKFIGYSTNSAKFYTFGTLVVAQFPFALAFSVRTSGFRFMCNLFGFATLASPYIIGPSRSPTLFLYFFLLFFCELWTRGYIRNRALALTSFVILVSFDVSRGLWALFFGDIPIV